MKSKNDVNHLYTPLLACKEAGLKALHAPRVTDAYSTSDRMIDEYIGGGYGRKEGYEIVLVFGDTGVNKSTFATQMILNPALKGKRITYFSLEDDRDDLAARIMRQLGGFVQNKFEDPGKLFDQISTNVFIAPDDTGYTLSKMAEEIKSLFLTGTDIIVIDPLQFIFEASVEEKGETEFNRQRLFMRDLNSCIKQAVRESGKSKTIILVSHTNKGRFDNAIDTIMGSGANKQVPTKIIQISRDGAIRKLNLVKSRFTRYRPGSHQITLDENTMLIRTADIPPDHQKNPAGWWDEVRAAWDRKDK